MPVEARSSVKQWLFLSLASLLVVVLAYEIARRQDFMANGDFFDHWLGGRLIWTSKNIYDPSVWLPEHEPLGNTINHNPVFPYPPIVAFVMAPFGLLPLSLASVSWVITSAGLIFLSTRLVLSLAGMHERLAYLLPATAGVYLFRPVMVTLRNGQLGAVFLICAVLAFWFLTQRRWIAGGVALSLLVMRPPLGLPIIGMIGIWLFLKKRWEALGSIAISLAALALISWLRYPQWLGEWLKVGDTKLLKTFGYHPNIWGLSGLICKHDLTCTLAVGSFVMILIFLALVLLLARRTDESDGGTALALMIPAGLLVTPYVWAYDQILLVLPILAVMIQTYRIGSRYLLTATIPLLMSCFALALLLGSLRVGTDAPSGVLTITCLVWLLLLLNIRSKRQATSSPPIYNPPTPDI